MLFKDVELSFVQDDIGQTRLTALIMELKRMYLRSRFHQNKIQFGQLTWLPLASQTQKAQQTERGQRRSRRNRTLHDGISQHI